MMKKIFYSYLLNKERKLEESLRVGEREGELAVLHRTKRSAQLARNLDCYDGESRPGKLIKITLEPIDG